MKRFHVHVAVKDLESSVRFYSTLFGAEPTVQKADYAKWMVDDPRINFAISQRGGDRFGVNHLGLQVDSDGELEALRAQAERADLSAAAEKEVNCCYARGNKYWYTDPQGIAWETYHTLGQLEFFGDVNGVGEPGPKVEATAESSCCAPAAAASIEAKSGARAACC